MYEDNEFQIRLKRQDKVISVEKGSLGTLSIA